MSGKGSRTKGQTWERTLRQWFTNMGWTVINSNRSGYDGDDMRVAEIPWLSIEAKNQVKLDLAGWLKQAEKQCGPEDNAVVVHKRKGTTDVRQAYVTMTVETFNDIMGEIKQYEPFP